MCVVTAGGGTPRLARELRSPQVAEGDSWVRRHQRGSLTGGPCLSGGRAYRGTLAEPRCRMILYKGETKGATCKGARPCEDTLEVPYEAVVTVMPLKSA
jgi:hypothetical protein